MLQNLKLVVFDYPKYLQKNKINRQIMSDLLETKEDSFETVDRRYVSVGSLDFIGTHCMIYDVSNIFTPQLILSVRIIQQDRVHLHKLKMPSEEYTDLLPPKVLLNFNKYKSQHSNLIESGGLFIKSSHSFKNTGLPIVEIGMMMIVNYLLKCNTHHFIAATNTLVKASKWVAPMGVCQEVYYFTHPQVQQAHELFLFEDFNYRWISDMHEKYFSLWLNRIDIRPEKMEYNLNDQDLYNLVLNQLQKRRAS